MKHAYWSNLPVYPPSGGPEDFLLDHDVTVPEDATVSQLRHIAVDFWRSRPDEIVPVGGVGGGGGGVSVDIILDNITPSTRAACSLSSVPKSIIELLTMAVEVEMRPRAANDFRSVYPSTSAYTLQFQADRAVKGPHARSGNPLRKNCALLAFGIIEIGLNVHSSTHVPEILNEKTAQFRFRVDNVIIRRFVDCYRVFTCDKDI
ncbi:hypothetical protein PR048_014737 [Dryococelus australis]|uniref:Uncharacterized protein n=1 Tax=Dryococelus australis TaxID=614101 RepID=A0ABQ9HF60_9NEOP|nr:hypothetical protein PR048_014737 [Dryococelus australis]